ncbi:hydrogenase maturation protein [Denitromonas ohlonensis]|uniref:Hydrogenase maturation protein n=2 Tax=Denitromonas TaxID=139331 RepID=A0A557RUB9_9RHOO|nr:hydrogenase maturation protein [Denitromonas ohlonensis]TVO68752.1 hydrogenase maturation protein [Denitromonas ohlonensis]TVO72882.1 hydrogenase maturation protein [Denitromonas ohlonensis]
MRILLLTHSFNSLTQRLLAELREDGHEVSVEFDIADSVAEEAVALFAPDVIVAPFLKRAVPESIWREHLTLIVHPGIVGDRGPSALDWAIHNGEMTWGVTVLQAEAKMDAGPIWATREFPMRAAPKASVYRSEVSEGALAAVREALSQVAGWRAGTWSPAPLGDWPKARGQWRALMRQADRRIDWSADSTATVLAKIRAADGFPGVADALFGKPCHLFDAQPGTAPAGALPGAVVGRRDGAILRATVDGAVWIGHVKRGGSDHPFKLPATLAFADETAALPVLAGDADAAEIGYRESDDGRVGFLRFDFTNGAMGSDQCVRLREAIVAVGARPTAVLVLEGGRDFWSNGIHLNVIEAAESPADESWANINAMNDVCLALLQLTDKLTVAAMRGNAGAGGCFLALAADIVWAREGVVMNPHYKNMGNLFGSEYWSYLLPKRVGAEVGRQIMGDRLPLLARKAVALGLIDDCFGATPVAFAAETGARAAALAVDPTLAARIAGKQARRAADEAAKPLAEYRAEELRHMQRNFYGFDPSYHVARYHFVIKSPQSWTPRHLARHRDLGWQAPAAKESVVT